MKLTELDPGWWTVVDGRNGMGVTFLCPCCVNGPRQQYLGVWFENPIDGGPAAPPECLPAPRWKRTGETFETLTLAPSVDASQSGHWHGHIVDGEVT